MNIAFKATMKPDFKFEKIIEESVKRPWIDFQTAVDELSENMLAYMQTYITSHINREGSTGNLVRSIKRYKEWNTPGPEPSIFVGIGLISEMNELAPYWALLNYGGMSFAAHFGQGVGGHFNGNPPDSNKAGTGVGKERFTWAPYTDGSFVMFPKNPINAINYIENTKLKLDIELQALMSATFV
jgi:hypothetical protein